jgi:hypothetical protein
MLKLFLQLIELLKGLSHEIEMGTGGNMDKA